MTTAPAAARVSTAGVRVRDLAAAIPTWFLLGSLVVVSAGVRYVLGRRDPGPWVFIDELIYSELAKSFASSFDFSIRDVPSSAYGFVYPLVISPAYALFDSIPEVYNATKAINAVVMSLTAIPAYLIARRIISRPFALLAAVLVVSIPAMTYTGVVMTENVFYPLTLTSVLLMVIALERPTAVRQIAVFAAMAAAFYTRTQAVAFLPAYILAILIFVALEERASGERFRLGSVGRRLARFRLTWLVLAVGIIAFVALQLGRGESPSSSLGAYEVATQTGRRSVSETLRWLVYHLAELDLWLGVVPVVAMLILVASAASRSVGTRSLRAFAAVAVPMTLMLAIIVSMFNTSIANIRIEERNFFYAGALFLIALAWWVAEGLPRPPKATAIAIVVAAVLPGVIPYARFINLSAVSDTFGLLPLWGFQERFGLVSAELVGAVVLASIIVGLAALFVPKRFALVFPAIVLLYFAAAHGPVESRTNTAAAGALNEGIRVAPNWVDATVGPDAEVAVVWSGSPTFQAIWENEFFNRSLGPVYNLGAPLPGGLPETSLTADPGTGELRDANGQTVNAEYALTDVSARLFGEAIALDEGRGMVLYRVGGPLALSEQITGVYGNSWTGPEAVYTRPACAGGTLSVVMSSDPVLHRAPQTVVALSGETELARTAVDPSAEPKTFVVPLEVVGGACSVRFVITPTASPAEVLGGDDPRQLGVRMVGFVHQDVE